MACSHLACGALAPHRRLAPLRHSLPRPPRPFRTPRPGRPRPPASTSRRNRASTPAVGKGCLLPDARRQRRMLPPPGPASGSIRFPRRLPVKSRLQQPGPGTAMSKTKCQKRNELGMNCDVGILFRLQSRLSQLTAHPAFAAVAPPGQNEHRFRSAPVNAARLEIPGDCCRHGFHDMGSTTWPAGQAHYFATLTHRCHNRCATSRTAATGAWTMAPTCSKQPSASSRPPSPPFRSAHCFQQSHPMKLFQVAPRGSLR